MISGWALDAQNPKKLIIFMNFLFYVEYKFKIYFYA